MAIYHLHAAPIQRSQGHSAIAAAAYRAGEKLHDRQMQATHDYQRKRGVVQSEILAPAHAPAWVQDREELWNRVELAEKRRDGQLAREIRVALPDELTDEQRADLVFQFCRDAFVENGMIADISIHRPDRHGDERNHHAHILLTMRELDGDHFAARKQRDWNKEEVLQGWREMWAEYQNRALEEAGHDARVDHRTLEAQGIDRQPTAHLGKAATSMERRGRQTERGDQKRLVEEKNQTIDRLKEELSELNALIEAEKIIAEAQQEPHEEQPARSWEEQKQAAQSAFHDSIVEQCSKPMQPSGEATEPPTRTWEEQKAATQRISNDVVVERYRTMIRERGEISEYGLGKNWYDRTVTFFENMYYNATEYLKSGFQKHVGRHLFPAQGKDIELDLGR